MSDGTIERRVRWACFLALIALVLIALSVLVPTPLPVIVAMSAGQLIGTASLALYVFAIVADLRRARVLGSGRGKRGDDPGDTAGTKADR
jgi:hypothetical protein